VPAVSAHPEKPDNVTWEAAGGPLCRRVPLRTAAVRAVALKPGDTVGRPRARTGGVGTIAVQRAKARGEPPFLGHRGSVERRMAHRARRRPGQTTVAALAKRLRGTRRLTGRSTRFWTCSAAAMSKLAVTELGIDPQRVDTIIDFPAIERFGVRGEG